MFFQVLPLLLGKLGERNSLPTGEVFESLDMLLGLMAEHTTATHAKKLWSIIKVGQKISSRTFLR